MAMSRVVARMECEVRDAEWRSMVCPPLMRRVRKGNCG